MTLSDEPDDWVVVVPTRGDEVSLNRIENNVVARLPGVSVMVLRNGREAVGASVLEAHPQVRLLDIPGGGVSRARNAALTSAPARTLVFLDDDVVAERDALERLVQGQRVGGATVSTARVVAAPSEHPNAVLFTSFLGFDRGESARIWSLADAEPVSPMNVWDFGVGAAFAVDLHRLATACPPALFDERLSNGRPGCGTEDVDFFYQVYLAGLSVSYVADAQLEHVFLTDRAAIVAKCRQYALSDGAFYAKWRRRIPASDLAAEVTGWARRTAAQVARRRTGVPSVPVRSLLAEPLHKLIGGALWFFVLKRSS